MGHSKSSSKREIHSITDLSQKLRKISNKRSNFTLEGTGKITTAKAHCE